MSDHPPSGVIGRAARRIRVARWRFGDLIRYSRLLELLAMSLHVAGAITAFSTARRLYHLTRLYRRSRNRLLTKASRRSLGGYLRTPAGRVWREKRINWDHYAAALKHPAIERTLILKEPSTSRGERGVIYTLFEPNWLRLLSDRAQAKFLSGKYNIVFGSSWSPTDYALLALALDSLEDGVLVQPCTHLERDRIESFHPDLRCVPTLGCDWLDPEAYRPREFANREIDILMVANWAPFKRHWCFFSALRRLPKSLNIVLIGQDEAGYTVEDVKRQARTIGVRQDLRFLEHLPITEVRRHQCAAKTSVIFSRAEGYCGAVTESLFADAPVGVLDNAYLGPKAYINEQTGLLLDSRAPARSLSILLERAGSFRARDWAIEHISCDRSLAKLEGFLRAHEERHRRPWTTGLLAFHMNPYPVYRNPTAAAQAIHGALDDLRDRFPRVFPRA